MPSSNATFRTQVERIIRRERLDKPTQGTVWGVDGDRIDVRLGVSGSVVRHVEVIGDIDLYNVGDQVQLNWNPYTGRPLASKAATDLQVVGSAGWSAQPDNITIEMSGAGLRVKDGGIGMRHLSFTPALQGHKHYDDPLTRAGWQVTATGTIWKGSTFIHPDGQIVLGAGNNVIKLDSWDDEYRMWVGNVAPGSAPFSITKEGAINATSGSIAGWNILADRLSKNYVELDPAGQLLAGSGNDVAVMGTTQGDWRLWIGNATPSLAPFRVDKYGNTWLESAFINLTLQSDNYLAGLKGWKIAQDGDAEFNNVRVRGNVESVVFAPAVVSALSGNLVVTAGGVLVEDFDSTDTVMVLDQPTLAAGDIVQLKPSADRNEWMLVLGQPLPVEGGYSYQVERNLNTGAGAPYDFNAGEAVVGRGSGGVMRDFETLASGSLTGTYGAYEPGGSGGSSGGGWLELDGLTPFFGVVARQGPEWDQFTRVVQIGNLVGSPLQEYQETTWGAFFGDVFNYMVYDEDNGLRIAVLSGANSSIDTRGVTSDALRLNKVTTAPDYENQIGTLYLVNESGNLTIRIRIKDGTDEADFVVADEQGIVLNFYELQDVPASYVDQAGLYLRVNDAEDGLEYAQPTTWKGCGLLLESGDVLQLESGDVLELYPR